MNNSFAAPTPGPAVIPPAPLAVDLVRQLITKRYGFYVNDSWCGQLAAQLITRAAATECDGLEDYVRRLMQDGNQVEVARLAEAVLNGETHFLRTAPHFAALLETVVPAWRALPGAPRRLRIASLGCSTGEEPYSIAMVLHENLPAAELAQVEISGVDVNNRSLDHARAGCYGAFQLRDLSPARWEHWFTSTGTRWRIHPALQASVRFLQHNLLEPLPFAGLDAILCRNVMIYFDRHRVAACLHEFHRALRPGGFLFLGHAESAFAFPEFFEPVLVPDGVIYQNKAPH